MEFEDQEEQEEEMGLAPNYDLLANSSRVKMSGVEPGSITPIGQQQQQQRKSRYRECLKNHAVGIGGHAVDGCGEFMPAGAEGTLEALKCAACNCHRNFHRKESELGSPNSVPTTDLYFHHHPPPQFTPYFRAPAGYLHVSGQHMPLALPSTSGGGGGHSREDQEDVSNQGSSRKRFRTKFTQEQKENMLGLAERLGWRIQKHDEAVVQQFCNENGVKRHVLKVWMHNNKHTLGKKP
ncbi:hypothetical protein CRYUN_Cryun22dG0077400 [Craigia yunnanensis]